MPSVSVPRSVIAADVSSSVVTARPSAVGGTLDAPPPQPDTRSVSGSIPASQAERLFRKLDLQEHQPESVDPLSSSHLRTVLFMNSCRSEYESGTATTLANRNTRIKLCLTSNAHSNQHSRRLAFLLDGGRESASRLLGESIGARPVHLAAWANEKSRAARTGLVLSGDCMGVRRSCVWICCTKSGRSERSGTPCSLDSRSRQWISRRVRCA